MRCSPIQTHIYSVTMAELTCRTRRIHVLRTFVLLKDTSTRGQYQTTNLVVMHNESFKFLVESLEMFDWFLIQMCDCYFYLPSHIAQWVCL